MVINVATFLEERGLLQEFINHANNVEQWLRDDREEVLNYTIIWDEMPSRESAWCRADSDWRCIVDENPNATVVFTVAPKRRLRRRRTAND